MYDINNFKKTLISSKYNRRMPQFSKNISISESDYIPVCYNDIGTLYSKEDKAFVVYGLENFTDYYKSCVFGNIPYYMSYYSSAIYSRSKIEYLSSFRHCLFTDNKAFKNLTTDDYTLLMCIGVKKEYMFIQTIDEICLSNYILFINNKLFDDKDYKLIHKPCKEYINEIKQYGVDIQYTNRIQEHLFKPMELIPQFKTIEEMNDFLQLLKNKLKGNDN